MPRKQPVQERAAATVDAIVEAVERILERDGVDALTTNRIAEVAGVSIGTLYQYFPNKQALVAEVHGRYLAQTLTMCRAVLAAAARVPLVQVVARIGEALVALAGAQREIHRWLYELRAEAGFHEPHRRALDQLTDELSTFLAARDDVRFADNRAAAFALVHAIAGVVFAFAERRAHAEVDLQAVAAETVAMIRAYVATST